MTVTLEKLKVLFMAEESAPGICEESGLTAMLVFDAKYAPEFQSEVTNYNLGVLSKSRYFANCRRPIMTFSTYIRGSGTAVDDPPHEAMLYKAASLEEIIDTGVSVTYSFTSNKTLWKWLTTHFYYKDAGIAYVIKCCGCIATGVIRCEPCKPARIDWRLEGIFRGVTTLKDFYDTTTVPAFDATVLNNPQPPNCMDGGLAIDSYGVVSNMFEIDFGLELTPRPNFEPAHGHEVPYISDRNTTGTLQMEIPADLATELDVQGSIIDEDVRTFYLHVGAVPNNQYTILLDAQIINLTESPNGNIGGWSLSLGATSEDDTDFSLIFT